MAPVAAIDAGSNAIRLAVVDVGPTGVVIRRVSRRYPLRLGSDVFATGRVTAPHVDQLVRIFTDIAERLQRLGVSRYRAIATSAMRDAANGPTIATVLRRRTGLELEIVTGAEEGRIMRMTLMRALGSISSDCLLVDLGGGSVELERTNDVGGASLPMGTLRLLRRYPLLQQPVGRRRFDQVYDAIRSELSVSLGAVTPAEVAIGTGGNLDTLARLVPVARTAVPAIDVRRLAPLARRLGEMTASERARRFELRADRADVILPAAMVILALAELYALRLFVVPGTGIRESLLHTLVAESTRPSRGRDLLRARSYDLSLPDRRAGMAYRLFELLAALHGLWPPAAAPLEAAAYLLDGSGPDDRARAAREAIALVRHSPELDLGPRARAVAARTIGNAAGLEMPAGRMGKADLRAAEVLGAILRLAGAIVEGSAAWEPRVDLMRKSVQIEVGLAKPLRRRDVAPLERVIGRRAKIT